MKSKIFLFILLCSLYISISANTALQNTPETPDFNNNGQLPDPKDQNSQDISDKETLIQDIIHTFESDPDQLELLIQESLNELIPDNQFQKTNGKNTKKQANPNPKKNPQNKDKVKKTPAKQTEEQVVVGKVPAEDIEEPQEKEQVFEPEPSQEVSVIGQGDIMQVGITIDGSFHHYELQVCTMMEVPLDKRGIHVAIKNLGNVKKVMLTSNQFSSCDEILLFDCPAGEGFCKAEDLEAVDSANIYLKEEVCQNQYGYLYLLPDKIAQELELEVKIGLTDEARCEANPDEIPPVTDEEYCQELDPAECQSASLTICSRCMWASCNINNNGTKLETMVDCVPSKWNFESLYKMCSTNEDFSRAATENQTVDFPVCMQTSEENIGQSQAHMKTFKVVTLSFLVGFVLFLGFVCYYRYQARNNGKEICNPPYWCPNCLFPRTTSNSIERFLSIGRTREQEMVAEYQPPVL